MKQFFLCSIIICAVLMGNVCMGQVTQSGNSYTVTLSNIIQHNAPPGNATATPQATAGQRVVWLEYGDGSFTNYAVSTHTLQKHLNTNWLLISNVLYDTTVELAQRNCYSGTFSSSSPSPTPPADNSSSLLTAAHPNISLTPNVYDIVKKDTMCFAVPYKLNDEAATGANEYYAVFMYDNTAFSDPSSYPTFSIYTSSSTTPLTINFSRTYHSEQLVLPANVPAGLLSQSFCNGYNRFIVFKINNTDIVERNIFITLRTKNLLPASGSTNIKTALVSKPLAQNTYTLIDQYPIDGMNFRTSHDPNYITQYPVCMNLPIIGRTFNYRIHFQNTGEGVADKVEVTAMLPPGMILNNSSVVMGNNNNFATDQNMIFTHSIDQANNKIVFNVSKNAGSDLMGTYGLVNPLTNPVTMGDIYFTVQSTGNTPRILQAKASIKFHSLEPQLAVSGGVSGRWETPVITNIATSYYSNCTDSVYCNCIIPTGDNCTKFLRICWWWWIIIATGLIVIYTLVRKKKK